MLSGSRTARAYLLALGTAFLLAAPWFAAGGGYARITAFKAAAYGILTGLFLLLSLFDPPKLRGRKPAPERLLALGYLFFCLLSALCSPWKQTAFLGGSRREGLLHIALYVLSFLILSFRRIPRRGLTCAFAAALAVQDLVCLLQLAEVNALGLYPPGLGWADANLRYTGSFLGTMGNAGQTASVLAAASAFLYLSILQRGGKHVLLLPLLALNALLLAVMDVTAPILALGAVMLLSLLFYGRTLRGLCRWGCVSCLTGAFLGLRLLGDRSGAWGLGLTVLAGLCFLRLRRVPGDRDLRAWPPRILGLLFALALTLLPLYRGWYTPLREAAALLRGCVDENMGSGRIYIWRQVLHAVPAHLWLGTGPDTLAMRDLPPYIYYSREAGCSVTLGIDAAHCELLHTLVCCGLPAALCHLGLVLCAALGFFRRRGSGRICAGAAFCYALQALFGISMCSSAPIFWVFLALSLSEGGADPEPSEQK